MLEDAERRGLLRPGRHHRRADLREHRPRPRDGGGDQGLQDDLRHARQDVGGEDQPPASVRRRGGDLPDQRRARVATVVLLGRRPADPRGARRVPAEPVLQPSQPRGALPDHRPGDLAPDRGPDHAFVCGVGTGGTISGVGKYLKEQNPAVRVIGADPEGSIYSGPIAPYKVEGVGEDFWPGTFARDIVDEFIQVTDREVLRCRSQARSSGGHPRRRFGRSGAPRGHPGGGRSRGRTT